MKRLIFKTLFIFSTVIVILFVNSCKEKDNINDNSYLNQIAFDSIQTASGITYINYLVIGNSSASVLLCQGNDTLLAIPSSYKNMTVNSLADCALQNYNSLQHVIIPGSILSIGTSTFADCQSLTNLTIPDITTIGDYAFAGCNSLSIINSGRTGIFNVPASVTTMGNGVFQSCTSLDTIVMPSNISTISPHMFEKCTNLKYVSFPNGYTLIGDYAFNGCRALSSMSFDNVTSIGSNSFNSTNLASIVIPNSVTSIGDQAFEGCSNLASIQVVATTPPLLGSSAFDNCSGQLVIKVPQASLNAYQQDSGGWSQYASIIVGY